MYEQLKKCNLIMFLIITSLFNSVWVCLAETQTNNKYIMLDTNYIVALSFEINNKGTQENDRDVD
jgi:hypothetical protein